MLKEGSLTYEYMPQHIIDTLNKINLKFKDVIEISEGKNMIEIYLSHLDFTPVDLKMLNNNKSFKGINYTNKRLYLYWAK